MPPLPFVNCILATLALLACTYAFSRAIKKRKFCPEPLCARCGYTVLALTTPTCPECGAHLPTSGILPPKKSRNRLLAALFHCISILLPTPPFLPPRKKPSIRINNAILYSLTLLTAGFLLSLAANAFLTRHTFETGLLLTTDPTPPTLFLLLHSSHIATDAPPDDLYLVAAGPPFYRGATSTLSAPHGWTTTLPAGLLATCAWSRTTNQSTLTTPAATTPTPALTPADLARTLAAIDAPISPEAATQLTSLLTRAQQAPSLPRFTAELPSLQTRADALLRPPSTPDPIANWIPLSTTTRRTEHPPALLLATIFWLLLFLYALTLPTILGGGGGGGGGGG
ncbi:MAG: hypothetical protein ACTHN5_02330, partial [Phycisphaerae bacterium]